MHFGQAFYTSFSASFFLDQILIFDLAKFTLTNLPLSKQTKVKNSLKKLEKKEGKMYLTKRVYHG